MNKIGPAQHIAAALAFAIMAAAWAYFTPWAHVLFNRGPAYPVEPQQIYLYWQFR